MPDIRDSQGTVIQDSSSDPISDSPLRYTGPVEQAVGSIYTGLALYNTLYDLFGPPRWGIVDSIDGTTILEVDTVVSYDFSADSRLADFPIEEGGFGTYNKVITPQEHRVLLVKSGTETEKGDFLDLLEQIAQDLKLYTITTPEITYSNVNIAGFNYRRSTNDGATIIKADVRLREIRVVDQGAFTPNNSKEVASTSSASPQDRGAVQSSPAPSATVSKASSQLNVRANETFGGV